MSGNELLTQFIELFDGNRRAVGAEDGACIRVDTDSNWINRIDEHLRYGGDVAVGVYPLVPNYNWRCKWGCVDFDEGEEASWLHARRLQTLLAKCGVTAWIERSRSKGFHVWVFGDWTPAHIVRRGLLTASAAVGAPTREINPKAERFDNPSTLGNYVRLPYPGPAHASRRVVVDEFGNMMFRDVFVERALAARGLQGLEKLAALWQPPKPIIQRNLVEIDDEQLEQALERVSTRTIGVLLDGPTRGQGRSETLFWLAQMLVRDGLHTYDECVALVRHADALWAQKYVGRPDAERRYTEMIDKAWSE